MPPHQTFHLFSKLPPEIRAMVWKFHITRRGVRHYIVSSPRGRHYAAIDIETDTFANTLLTKPTIEKYWPEGFAVSGERNSYIRLIGHNFTPEPGSPAKSIVTVKHTRTWRKRRSPHIRIDYRRDLVYFGDGDTCFRPLFSLSFTIEPTSYQRIAADRAHWLCKVHHLAIQLGEGTPSLSPGDKAALGQLWRGSTLRTLYLVSYRDPKCPHGPPLQWPSFPREALDEHNFLPIGKFIKLHPKCGEVKCGCNLTTTKPRLIKKKWKDKSRTGTARVKIRIVVDPY